MILDRQRRESLHEWKQAVVNDFLRGESVQVIADRCFCKRTSVETALREAIHGLNALVLKQASQTEESAAV